jgi:hypothetical protein
MAIGDYDHTCRKCGLKPEDHFTIQAVRKRESNSGYCYDESVTVQICPTALYTAKGTIYEAN